MSCHSDFPGKRRSQKLQPLTAFPVVATAACHTVRGNCGLGGVCTLHFVAKCHHSTGIGLHLDEVQSNISVEPRKEWDSFPN